MINDSINPVLDRLAINARELTGITRVFRLAPSITVSSEETPFVVTRWGEMLSPIPRTYAGKIVVSRKFILDIHVKIITNSQDIDDLGVEALGLVAPYVQELQQYFVEENPRLSTRGTNQTRLGELQWIFQDILLLPDSGLIRLVGPGGNQFVGVSQPMQIDMYSLTSRSS